MKEYERLKMLEYPGGRLDLVIDTDAATEVDDPFAVAWALLSPERLCVRALYAAPFSMNERAADPADGMEQSFRELYRLLGFLGMEKAGEPRVCRGARRYMAADKEPVPSEAAEDLIRRAAAYTAERPLYVAALGAGTNLASALRKCPQIAERIVVVWLAGDDFNESPRVYNIYQDVPAAQVIFDSGVPLVHVPCNYVASHLLTGTAELEACIGGKNPLCDYLVESVRAYGTELFAWGKQIWDLAVIAYLLREDYAECEITSAPLVTDNLTWSRDYHRHLIKNVKRLRRDEIFRDLYRKLGGVRGEAPKGYREEERPNG